MPRVGNGTREKTRTFSGLACCLCARSSGGGGGQGACGRKPHLCSWTIFCRGRQPSRKLGGGCQGLEQTGCAPAPTGKGDMRGASFWLLALGTFS